LLAIFFDVFVIIFKYFTIFLNLIFHFVVFPFVGLDFGILVDGDRVFVVAAVEFLPDVLEVALEGWRQVESGLLFLELLDLHNATPVLVHPELLLLGVELGIDLLL